MKSLSMLAPLLAIAGMQSTGPSRTVSFTSTSSPPRTKQSSAKSGNRSGRRYPFSSMRQDARAAKKYYMKTVNGFEIMQTRPSKEIAARELKLAA
jgi:hypothetical protein